MIEIIDDKFIKVISGSNESTFPKSVLVSINDVTALEFDCVSDGADSYYSAADNCSIYSWWYVFKCTIKLNTGSDITVDIWWGRISSKTNGAFNDDVRKKFDKLTDKLQQSFLKAKASFQTAVRNEAFELLMTNKLINQKTL
jgi:hypothetical protein